MSVIPPVVQPGGAAAAPPAPPPPVAPVPPAPAAVVPPPPPPPPPPVVAHVAAAQPDADEQVRQFFAKDASGKRAQFYVSATVDDLVLPYVGKPLMTIFGEPGVGVLAQEAIAAAGDTAKLVFVPFAVDESTKFTKLTAGIYQFAVAAANSPVHDLGTDGIKELGEFYPPFVDELARMQSESAQRAAAMAAQVAAAQTNPVEQFKLEYAAGTIIQIGETEDPNVAPFVGKVGKSTYTDGTKVMLTFAAGQGVDYPISIPFDGKTELIRNPAGTFSFASGVTANQQIYDVETRTYTTYDTIYPYYEPVIYPYYDSWAVPAGVVAGVLVADALFGYGPGYIGYDPYW